MRVEYTWPFFYTQRGHLADACSGWTEWFSPKHVRKGRAISISSYYMAMAHAISTILSPGAGGGITFGDWARRGTNAYGCMCISVSRARGFRVALSSVVAGARGRTFGSVLRASSTVMTCSSARPPTFPQIAAGTGSSMCTTPSRVSSTSATAVPFSLALVVVRVGPV